MKTNNKPTSKDVWGAILKVYELNGWNFEPNKKSDSQLSGKN